MQIRPLTSSFSTAYLVVDGDRAMLVDAAYDAITPKVLTTLDEVGAKLELIVLTHFHYDHVGAADSLRRATGATVAIHRDDAEALRRGGRLVAKPTRLRGKLLARSIAGTDRAAVTPDLELGDDEQLEQYGGLGRSFSTPGHTPGSISVVLPNATVLVGDALSETIVPRHIAEPPLLADDAEQSKRSIVAIADASQGDVRVAHLGSVTARSVDRLAERARTGRLRY